MTAALNAGERWRADIRASRHSLQIESSETSQTLQLKTEKGEVVYRFETNTVTRSVEGQPRDSTAFECDDLGNAGQLAKKGDRLAMGGGTTAACQGILQAGSGAPRSSRSPPYRKERRPVKFPVRNPSRRNHGSAVVVMIVLLGCTC